MEVGCASSSRGLHAGFPRGEVPRPDLGALALAALLGGALGFGAALLGLRLRPRAPEVRAGEGAQGQGPRPRDERPQLTPHVTHTQDAVAAFALKAQVVYPINQRYQPLINANCGPLTRDMGQGVGSRRPKARAADVGGCTEWSSEQEEKELEALPGSVAWGRHGDAERELQSATRSRDAKRELEIEPDTEDVGVARRGAAVGAARRRQGLPGCLAEVLVLESEERLHAALSSLVQRSCRSLQANLHRQRCVLLEMMLKELCGSNGEQRMNGPHNEELGTPDQQEGRLGNGDMDDGFPEELGESLSHSASSSSWINCKTQLTVCRYLSSVDAYLLQLQDEVRSAEREAEWHPGTLGQGLLDRMDWAPGALIQGLLLGECELAKEAAKRAFMLDERMLAWERAVRARVSTLESRQRVLEAARRSARLVLQAPNLKEEHGCRRADEAVRAFQCGLLGLQDEFDRRWEEESTALLIRLAEYRQKRLGARPGLGRARDRIVKRPSHAFRAPLHRSSIPALVQQWKEEMSEEVTACGSTDKEVDVEEVFAISQLHESLQGTLLRALDMQMEEMLGPSGLGTDGARVLLCRLREELRETHIGTEQWRRAQEEHEELLAARKEREERACLVMLGQQRLQERETRILSGILREVPGLAPGAVHRAQFQSELWVSLWSGAMWVPPPLRPVPRLCSGLWPSIVGSEPGGLQGPRIDAMQRKWRRDVVLCGHTVEVARAAREDLRQRTRTLLEQLLVRGDITAGPLLVN
ncbi:evC complex member EVC isoform X2 [Lampetra planeri]